MKRELLMAVAVLLAGGVFLTPAPVVAHQPYCEEDDLTLDTAWGIRDANVSTAFYGTLEDDTDVDYFTLEAAADQRVYLSITIPQIEGQADFDPVIGVFGPGLPDEGVAAHSFRPAMAGGLLLASTEATEFYEPFGGRYYWDRQEAIVALPEAAEYVIAVWHPEGEIGRYTFVYGQREVMGGDYGCNSGDYWTPVGNATEAVDAPAPSLLEQFLGLMSGGGADATHHDHDDDHAHDDHDHDDHVHDDDHAHDNAHDHADDHSHEGDHHDE